VSLEIVLRANYGTRAVNFQLLLAQSVREL